MRIAVGGFQIESCTFSPLVSGPRDFVVTEGKLGRQYDFVSRFADCEFIPLLRARALPGGPVDRAFYEDVKARLLRGLRERGPWDGVFMHLHGAANVVGMDDAEGDLLEAVRELVGPEPLIASSYDLHGNVSLRVMQHLDILSAYRTAPHVDWHDTLERAFALLVECLRRRVRPYKAFIPVPILLPGEQTSTEWEPGASLYKAIPTVISPPKVMDASILIGYVWADEPRATGSVVALGMDRKAVQQAAMTLAQRFWQVRHEFRFGAPAAPVDECIQMALDGPEQPVIISDSGDNPTAGGVGDVPYLLERLLALDVPDAIYASLTDPTAVNRCIEAGVGAEVDLALGGKLDPVHGHPLPVHGRVISLHSRHAETENRIAVVQVQGVQVIVTERRTPFHHRADFARLGIDPMAHKIVVVKIGYLVPELKQMAARSLLALSPGAVNQDITALPFERLCRPMYPFDPHMKWEPPPDCIVTSRS